jgi:hypothetical protein
VKQKALQPRVTRENGWVAIAFDVRTGHYWHARPESTTAALPQCGSCGRYMTDWSLINECGLDVGP